MIPGIKEEVHFSARNTVSAVGLLVPDFYGFPTDVLGEIYKRSLLYADFEGIVKRVSEGKQLYNNNDANRLALLTPTLPEPTCKKTVWYR